MRRSTPFDREFKNMPWINNFLDQVVKEPESQKLAAKRALEKDSFSFLHNYSDKPWAQPYTDEAAKRAAREDPFRFLYNFSHEPWAQPYIDEAVKGAAKINPEYFLEKWADRFPQGINVALFSLGNENVTK